jgi:C-terminal processing protease CtpA/Prc
MKLIFTLLLLAVINTVFGQQATRDKFSAAEIRDDLAYLYKTLDETHYNLYVNCPKKTFDRTFKRLTGSITDSMTVVQSHRLFQPFVALSRVGHCNISYPFSPGYVNYVMNKGTMLPFDISVNDNRLLITANYSADSSIRPGDQILSINSIPAGKYLQKMYAYMSGENDFLKNTQIDLLYFSRVNWFIYDRQDVYTLKIKHKTGEIDQVTVKAITAMDYEGAAGKKKAMVNTSRDFKFIGDIAYLRPGVFLNTDGNANISDHKAFEKGTFVHFIDSCFARIRKSNAKDLIIDLRGNPGGDNSFSDEMIAYFAAKPFYFCSKFYVRTSAVTKSFWKDVKDTALTPLQTLILENENGKIMEAPDKKISPKADSLRFNGNVYVLIDRYSYSNAVSSAALIQDYRFGTILGERTADSPTTMAAIHQFNLPFTQMTVSYPKALIIRPNGDRSIQGVIPDIQITDNPFNEADEILDSAVKMINGKK